MLKRRLEVKLQNYLKQFPAVCLIGPRQVGKTTLARLYGQKFSKKQKKAHYLDLENPRDFQKLTDDPVGYLENYQDRLIILDEVQLLPNLFKVLRGLIDERILKGKKAGHFLILGSASIELLKQSSESLAGRIAYLEMAPLDILEAPKKADLWWRGGFPDSLLAVDDSASILWRDQFVKTYLERDIPLLGPRIPAETLRRFWTMLAHYQGSVLNAAQLARSLGVTGNTIAGYLDLLVDLLLVRRLEPYHPNIKKRLVKSPKVYLKDSGLVHSLLQIDSAESLLAHPIVGMSWEGYVIENILRVMPNHSKAYFYRTQTDVEIDLVLRLPKNQIWAIEIKRTSAPKVERGFWQALEDIKPNKAFIVYPGNDRYPKTKNVEVIGLKEIVELLAKMNK